VRDPDGFLGLASAAYQIEGPLEHGWKGESNWDRFSQYRRLKSKGEQLADVSAITRPLQRKDNRHPQAPEPENYRLSTSWFTNPARGRQGPVTSKGRDFYSRFESVVICQRSARDSVRPTSSLDV